MSRKLIVALAAILLTFTLSACTGAQTQTDADTDIPATALTIEELSLPGISLESAPYVDGRMAVYSQDNGEKRWGYLDADGNIAIDAVCLVPNSFSGGLLRTKIDADRYVYLDTSGNVVIDRVADADIVRCDMFFDGYTVVELSGQSGQYVIDASGNIVLSPEEQGYYYTPCGGGLFERSTSNAVDPDAVIVSVDKDASCYDGICNLQYSDGRVGFYSVDEELFGLWSFETNERITEPQYVYITPFSDGIAVVSMQDGSYYIINEKGNITAELSRLFPSLNTGRVVPFCDGTALISLTDSEGLCLIDAAGNIVKRTDYDRIYLLNDGVAVCVRDGLYGYCNASGDELVAPQYQYACNFDNGVAFATDGSTIYRITK